MIFGIRFHGFVMAWALSCISFAASDAMGAPLPELTGASDSPNPLSARFLQPGLSAAYFNPAFLPEQSPGFSMGTLGVFQFLSVSLEPRGTQYDVDGSIFEARPLSGMENMPRPLPTADLLSRRGSWNPSSHGGFVTIGSLMRFARERISIGFMGIFPLGSFQEQQPFFSDEREQYFSNSLHFELYEDRLRSNVVVLGAGGKISDRVAIGAGVTMSTSALTKANIFMPDASRQNESHMNTAVAVNTRFIPHFGMLWRPTGDFCVTAALHAPGGSSTSGESTVQFWNYRPDTGDASVVQHFRMVYGYEPLRVALGISGGTGRPFDRWEAAAGLRYERWSDYEDRHGERPADAWSDTLVWTAGVRRTFWGQHAVGLDAAFSPSPVPEQTGRSNYVDNDRITLAAGYETRLSSRWHAGVSAAAHVLLSRSHAKDPAAKDPVYDEYPDSTHIFTGDFIPQSAGFQTNNPGFPGFSSSGLIFAVMGYVKIETD